MFLQYCENNVFTWMVAISWRWKNIGRCLEINNFIYIGGGELAKNMGGGCAEKCYYVGVKQTGVSDSIYISME